MIQAIGYLQERFKKYKFPTQQDFWDLFDSFWHKDEKIPIGQVEGWQEAFDDATKEINTSDFLRKSELLQSRANQTDNTMSASAIIKELEKRVTLLGGVENNEIFNNTIDNELESGITYTYTLLQKSYFHIQTQQYLGVGSEFKYVQYRISSDGVERRAKTATTGNWTAWELKEEITVFNRENAGLAPSPGEGGNSRFLREDGVWSNTPNTTYPALSKDEAGQGTSTEKCSITAEVLKYAVEMLAPATDLDGVIPKSDFQQGTANYLITDLAFGAPDVDKVTLYNDILQYTEDGEKHAETNSTVIPAATNTLAGVMSAADKAKLDGIEAGAQKNVPTPEQLPQVDGTGDLNISSSFGPDLQDVVFDFAQGNLKLDFTEWSGDFGGEINVLPQNMQPGDVRYLTIKGSQSNGDFDLGQLKIDGNYLNDLIKQPRWLLNANFDLAGGSAALSTENYFTVVKLTYLSEEMKFVDIDRYYNE